MKHGKLLIGVTAVTGGYLVANGIAKHHAEDEHINDDNPYISPFLTSSAAEKRTFECSCNHGLICGKQLCTLSERCEKSVGKRSFYITTVKPALDRILSFTGLIVLAPVFGAIALAVFVDDPGPVFFTQKRIGKNKTYFYCHKFRTMKMSTPHDVPTHQLENPESYITKIGAVLRRTSLDELPQIWDIFRGKMSVIGPRPALWNQDDLVAEREKYGANCVMPGLTGMAQIHGRDELEIADKARIDGEYTNALGAGGLKAWSIDAQCFFGTIKSVLSHDGVVEGGTGTLASDGSRMGADNNKSSNVRTRKIESVDSVDAGFEDYGCYKHFNIDKEKKAKVLIAGTGSYIGESFKNYCALHYTNIECVAIDMRDPSWQSYDFSAFNTVFHVSGIAHADVGRTTPEQQERYYAVNTDLAIECAKKAKKDGVSQFIFMSSMIVYGGMRFINDKTVPSPANFYGNSKWLGDVGVRKLGNEHFKVAVLRPPMIYGKDSRGNYPTLAKLARRLPIFPDVENKRSMLYIENLCEFVGLIILSGEGGIYFPQNAEYSTTSDLVKAIGNTAHSPVRLSKTLTPAVELAKKVPGKVKGLADKAFGSSYYDQRLSQYSGLDYQKVSLEESIKRTEGTGAETAFHFNSSDRRGGKKEKQHILLISQYFYPETFRVNDMAAEWVKRGYKVTVLTGIPNYPMGKFFDGYDYKHKRREIWNGVDIIRIPLIPRGNNGNKLLNAAGMSANYLSFVVSGRRWVKKNDIGADLVYTYEVSPMTQALIGIWYSKKYHIPHYLYVTDLWPENVESVTGVHSRGVIKPIQKMVDYIYKNTDRIFTCSKSFISRIEARGISKSKIEFWPQYAEEFYKPAEREGDLLPQDGILNLVFAGSVGFAQGLDILVKAAEKLKKDHIIVRFHIIGDGRYLAELQENIKTASVENYFNFIPRQTAEDIPRYLAFADALLITLSKSDVFSITLPAKTQSCFACGRPVLVSADGEIQEIVNRAGAGLCSGAEDVDGFVKNIKKMMEMDESERKKMAENALAYAEEYFNKDRQMDRLDEVFMSVRD